jgi:toxin ParE1/3/4
LRYEALLTQAIIDVANRPEIAGSVHRPELASAARTYHLYDSRKRVPAGIERVKQPRHFLLYRMLTDGSVEIGRVLHDSMELPSHLPPEYGS